MEDRYIGKLLDNRYEIIEKIGVGGMAVVYKAKCHRLNRMVALKMLKPELAEDAEIRRRFRDESQAVAMLSHPNIVAVYDVSKSSEAEYIVMELMDGITLKQYMYRKGEPLNWREVLHFITQIVRALGHAHSRGIIHRDIKPQNVMILRDGSVRVADFGIARLTSAEQCTLTQEALGSVHYISPEQARGSRIDCRSDLYSAGVVLYEMLTGRLPFEGDSPVSVAIQHINSIPLSPRELNPDIPEALEAITMKAMASNVANRYVNADEMLADLEEFRKNPNINFDYSHTEVSFSPEVDEPTQAIPVSGKLKRTGGIPVPPKKEEPEEEDFDEYDDDEDDDYYYDSGKGGIAPILLGIAALLVFFVGIAYFLYVTFFSGLLEPAAQYTIPELMGKTMTEIQLDASVTDVFTVEVSGQVFSDAPVGAVVFQEPAAGLTRKAGDLTIKVKISAGQEHIVMINPAGKEWRIASLELEKLGLKVDTPEYIPSDEVPKGYVVSCTPEEGTALSPGDVVHLFVSTGPKNDKVLVPQLVGESMETAKQLISESNLIIGECEYKVDMSLPGVILGQSIVAGTEVTEGTFVDLVISMGPVGAEEPDPEPNVSETPNPGNGEIPGGTAEPSEPPAIPLVTPAPEPTPNNKSVPVYLGGGSGTVQVTISVGGKLAYDNAVDRSLGMVNIVVSGIGIQEVVVYLDGEVVTTQTIDFSA